MRDGSFLTIEETAHALGVSPRHVRRLSHAGKISKVARGLFESASVERYIQSQRLGRTRAWAEPTAWAVVALLNDQAADWLGATQTSRLRQTLRNLTDTDELVARMRDRTHVNNYDSHPAALPHLKALITPSNTRWLGIVDSIEDRVDGYLAAHDLDHTVRSLGLRANTQGVATLRTTDFDFSRVREWVDTPVVAALDAATSTDPRMRGAGRQVLNELLESYR